MAAKNRVLFEWIEIVWIDFRISNRIYSLKTAREYFPFKIERVLLVKNKLRRWALYLFLAYIYKQSRSRDLSSSKFDGSAGRKNTSFYVPYDGQRNIAESRNEGMTLFPWIIIFRALGTCAKGSELWLFLSVKFSVGRKKSILRKN